MCGALEWLAARVAMATVFEVPDYRRDGLVAFDPVPLPLVQVFAFFPAQGHASRPPAAKAQPGDGHCGLAVGENASLFELPVPDVAVVQAVSTSASTSHQASPGCGGNAHFHSEFVGLARLACAKAFDFGGQGVGLVVPAPGMGWLKIPGALKLGVLLPMQCPRFPSDLSMSQINRSSAGRWRRHDLRRSLKRRTWAARPLTLTALAQLEAMRADPHESLAHHVQQAGVGTAGGGRPFLVPS